MGRIFAADTIAVSSPAFTHSCRNTEFSTCGAAFTPNDTFEMPSVVGELPPAMVSGGMHVVGRVGDDRVHGAGGQRREDGQGIAHAQLTARRN